MRRKKTFWFLKCKKIFTFFLVWLLYSWHFDIKKKPHPNFFFLMTGTNTESSILFLSFRLNSGNAKKKVQCSTLFSTFKMYSLNVSKYSLNAIYVFFVLALMRQFNFVLNILTSFQKKKKKKIFLQFIWLLPGPNS